MNMRRFGGGGIRQQGNKGGGVGVRRYIKALGRKGMGSNPTIKIDVKWTAVVLGTVN